MHVLQKKLLTLFGDREKVGNYRSVSLSPLPGKLLEKIVHKRITEFWDNNSYITRDQRGFRKGHSTVAMMADLRTDRSRREPFLFLFDYFKSI